MYRFVSWLVGGVLALGAVAVSHGAGFPEKAVRIVVPFAAGGGGDFIARAWADKLSAALGQPVIVDNRGGGNTVIGTDVVAKASPDGYTLLLVSPAFATNPALLPRLPYAVDDFEPVALLITYAMGLAARADLPAATIPELRRLAASRAQPLSIASSGEGAASHLAAELLRQATGMALMDVQYRGAGPALADVAAGHVDLSFTGMSQIRPHLDSGRVRLLATSGRQRLASAQDVPTIAEQGVKDFEAVVWWGVLAPKGTPAAVVARLNEAFRRSLADPEVTQRLSVIDGVVDVSTPAAFGALIRSEVSRWGTLLKRGAGAAR